MLLAIDVGNTHTVLGLWDAATWSAVWRCGTNVDRTEDELASTLKGLFDLSDLPFRVEEAICASVVPPMIETWELLCSKWLDAPMRKLENGAQVGLKVDYAPPHAVGADRIANALGALKKFKPPIVVVDFGTATTFDTVDREGTYVGGAILPGIQISTQALADRTSNLPQFELTAPKRAIGKTTTQSLRSGTMLGYAGAIDAVARQIDEELGGGSTIVATGGLGDRFLDLCETLTSYEPTLTLEGLVVANDRLRGV